jgi:SPX domain protein involved in polyphosphate accumulation
MTWDSPALLKNKFGHHQYTVTSAYYDSLSLKLYHDKMFGLRDRFKIRIRTYADNFDSSRPEYLEIKKKHGLHILKERVELLPGMAKDIVLSKIGINQGKKSLQSNNDLHIYNTIYFFVEGLALKPRAIIKYTRRPLMGQGANRLRITFDSDIMTANVYKGRVGQLIRIPQNNMVIMEVKHSGALCGWVRNIIKRYNLEQVPYSKYCKGVEYLQKAYYL